MKKIYRRVKSVDGSKYKYYVVRYTDDEGRERDKQFKLRLEAEAFLKSNSPTRARTMAPESPGGPTFEELSTRFLDASKVGRGGKLIMRSVIRLGAPRFILSSSA